MVLKACEQHKKKKNTRKPKVYIRNVCVHLLYMYVPSKLTCEKFKVLEQFIILIQMEAGLIIPILTN